MDPFIGWQIWVSSDPKVIDPTSLSIMGSVLAVNDSLTAFESVNCVNGGGKQCDVSTNGPGIVESSVVFIPGNPLPPGPISGLLFTITYKVVGLGTYSAIHMVNSIFADGTPNPVPSAPQDGLYGIAPGQDFSLNASPLVLSMGQGFSTNVSLTISEIGGYSGIVNITATTPASGLSLSLNATSIALSPSPTNVTLTVTTGLKTNAISYIVTVTGNSGTLSHQKTLTVSVNPPSDFAIGATPSGLKVHATSSGSSIINLVADRGFSGTIHLKMDVPPVLGLVATLAAVDLNISYNNPASTVFSVRTPPSAVPFKYLINITASSQSSTHGPVQIVVTSPSPDFSVQVGTSGYVVQAGQSRIFTLNTTSVDYFKGQIFLLASALSGIKSTFTRPSVHLDISNSSTSVLTIVTDAYLSPGNHDINVTALGTTFLGAPVNHSILITVIVIPVPIARTILGLQPVAYFGIVGLLWLGIIGAAVREIRKPKTKRFLG
jgi:hypothetical protein